ncbi:MAG: ankyrin repeat domain-containing protein [Verrucomicrobiota bacterium]
MADLDTAMLTTIALSPMAAARPIVFEVSRLILVIGFATMGFSSCSHQGPQTIEDAVRSNDASSVAAFLERGSGPDLGSDGSGLLHVATGPYGGNDVLSLLLHAGAQPNFTDPHTGDTALMNAAMWVNLEAVRILVAAGADQRIDEAIELTGDAGGLEQAVIDYLRKVKQER